MTIPRFALAFLFLAVASLSSPVRAGETLTLAADEWCPYNCTPSDVQPGYIVELVKQAFAKHDITVEYNVIPWAQAVDKTRKGEYNAVIGASQADAPDFVFPEAIVGMSIMEFWVRKNYSWTYQGINSLDRLRIGVIEGYSYSKMFDLYVNLHLSEKERVQIARGDKALDYNLHKLEAGMIDLTVEDRNVVRHYYETKNEPVNIQPAGSPLDHDKPEDSFIYVAFSPANPKSAEYAAILSQGIGQMRANGELKALLDRYGVEDWYPQSQR